MILVLNPFKIKNGIVFKLNLLGTKKSKKRRYCSILYQVVVVQNNL